MLIKFLSSIASLLSNATYKAVIIPCFILALAGTGLTLTMIAHTAGSGSPAASTEKKEQQSSSQKQQTTSQLGGLQKQAPKDQAALPSGNAAADKAPSPTPSQTVDTQPAAINVNVSLSAATVNLVAGDAGSITATTSDGSMLAWTVTPHSSKDIGVNSFIEQAKDNTAVVIFRFRASEKAEIGTHTFTITAKDAARNVAISKTITVNIAS